MIPIQQTASQRPLVIAQYAKQRCVYDPRRFAAGAVRAVSPPGNWIRSAGRLLRIDILNNSSRFSVAETSELRFTTATYVGRAMLPAALRPAGTQNKRPVENAALVFPRGAGCQLFRCCANWRTYTSRPGGKPQTPMLHCMVCMDPGDAAAGGAQTGHIRRSILRRETPPRVTGAVAEREVIPWY